VSLWVVAYLVIVGFSFFLNNTLSMQWRNSMNRNNQGIANPVICKRLEHQFPLFQYIVWSAEINALSIAGGMEGPRDLGSGLDLSRGRLKSGLKSI